MAGKSGKFSKPSLKNKINFNIYLQNSKIASIIILKIIKKENTMSNRDKVRGNGLADVLGILAETVAFFTIVLFLVMLIQANWPFIPAGTVLDILNVAMYYAPLVLTLIVCLQVTSRQPLIVRLIFYIIIVAIIVFQFFPGTWSNMVKAIK